jgi:hypothetical protein
MDHVGTVFEAGGHPVVHVGRGEYQLLTADQAKEVDFERKAIGTERTIRGVFRAPSTSAWDKVVEAHTSTTQDAEKITSQGAKNIASWDEIVDRVAPAQAPPSRPPSPRGAGRGR